VATHAGAINLATMKTTLEISDPLLREARKIAAREQTTLRAVVEQGLRRIIAEKARKPGFRLRDASFDGRGPNPEFADAGWDRLRDLIYDSSPKRR
jgi:Bacterial antitoxin of type II TA system, VapB